MARHRRPMATPKQPDPVLWQEIVAGVGFIALLGLTYFLLALIAV